MDVTVLHVADCPNLPLALERLEEAIRRSQGADVSVAVTLVRSPDEARRLGLVGSPTILVDGRDPFSTPDAAPGISCRLFPTATGVAGAPSVEELQAALAS